MNGKIEVRDFQPLYTDQILKFIYSFTQKEDIDDEFGKIVVDLNEQLKRRKS